MLSDLVMRPGCWGRPGSVGATRGRLIRQLLTESLLLSAAGGTLALPLAGAARRLLPFGQAGPFNWRVFAFAGALSLAAGIAFSPLLAGRGFEPRDDADAPRVAVVNAAAATELFGTDDAVGRRFGFDPEERGEVEVVGVVRDTRYDDPRGPPYHGRRRTGRARNQPGRHQRP